MACYFNGKDPLGTGKNLYGFMQPGALNSQLFDWYKDVANAWTSVVGGAKDGFDETFSFNPDTMEPLINSPGHVAALEWLKKAYACGPSDFASIDLGGHFNRFAQGEAVFAWSAGDISALSQEKEFEDPGQARRDADPGLDRDLQCPRQEDGAGRGAAAGLQRPRRQLVGRGLGPVQEPRRDLCPVRLPRLRADAGLEREVGLRRHRHRPQVRLPAARRHRQHGHLRRRRLRQGRCRARVQGDPRQSRRQALRVLQGPGCRRVQPGARDRRPADADRPAHAAGRRSTASPSSGR